MLKKVIVVPTIALMLFSATPAKAASFAGLYVGDSDDIAVSTFKDMMIARGWSQEVYKTGEIGASQSDYPYHYHFTNGPNDSHQDAANEADLVFIAGHGQRNATIEVWWNGQQQPDQYVGADTGVNPVYLYHPTYPVTHYAPSWEVGVDWINYPYTNESRWNSNVEWVILGACSQLDKYHEYYPSDESQYPGETPTVYLTTNGAAKAWGRTLIGTPNRAHQILGYYRGAPGGTTMRDRIQTFIQEATNNQVMTLDSWELANEPYFGLNYHWAALTHWGNRLDYLHGISSGATADTSTSQPYYIDYYRCDIADSSDNYAGRILDGRGGGYETISSSNLFCNLIAYLRPKLEGITNYAKQMVTGKPVYAAGDKLFTPTHKKYVLKTTVPERIDMENLQTIPNANETKLVESLFGETRAREEKDNKDNNVKVYKDGKRKLTVWPTGAVAYDNGEVLSSDKLNFNKEEAVEKAKQFINNNDLVSAELKVDRIYETTKTRLNLESTDDDSSAVVQYKVVFRRSLNNVKVEGNAAEVVSVTIDNKGIRRYERYLNDLRSNGTTSKKESLITGDQALNSFIKNADGLLDIPGDAIISDLKLVHFASAYNSQEAKTVPAWRITVDGDQVFYADAISGELLCE